MAGGGIDVAVVGDGPAGSALARELTRLGADVVLFGSDRPWDATYTTWIDDLDDVAVIDGAEIWLHRFDSVSATFERSLRVDRPYGVLDNEGLRASLRHGVAHERRQVASPGETGARIVIDATGWPSGLDPRDGRLVERGALAWQTAIGVVLDAPPDGALGLPTVMDFTDAPVTGTAVADGLGVASFVYAFPVADGWLVEETVLAGPAVDPDRLLPRLAARLGESVEHLVERARRVERVRIPMGAPLPTRRDGDPSTVRFGAAAGMIHPATGYSVASSLRATGRVAAAVVGRLTEAPDAAADAAAVADAVWPKPLRRTRRLHDFGLDVLVGMDAAEIRSFFQTFFELPTARWAAYLRIDTAPRELASVMTAMFTQADWALRRQLVTGNPRSLLRVLAP